MENKFIEEDFERCNEQVYLEEYKRVYEAEYWEWYNKSEGKVILKHSDGTETEIDENLKSYKLPF